jgi:putative PIN family toxin of toxin-antitoxin system
VKVFLDTNVLVSALATRGLCADLYERLLAEHVVVIGEPVVLEVLDILQRKFRAPGELLIKVEVELRLLRVIPAQTVAPVLAIRDADDPWIIACALQADVDCFVTGDAELLALGNVGNLTIISPRTCWEKLGN